MGKTDEELVDEAHQADLRREEENLKFVFDKPKKIKKKSRKMGQSRLMDRFDEDSQIS